MNRAKATVTRYVCSEAGKTHTSRFVLKNALLALKHRKYSKGEGAAREKVSQPPVFSAILFANLFEPVSNETDSLLELKILPLPHFAPSVVD